MQGSLRLYLSGSAGRVGSKPDDFFLEPILFFWPAHFGGRGCGGEECRLLQSGILALTGGNL